MTDAKAVFSFQSSWSGDITKTTMLYTDVTMRTRREMRLHVKKNLSNVIAGISWIRGGGSFYKLQWANRAEKPRCIPLPVLNSALYIQYSFQFSARTPLTVLCGRRPVVTVVNGFECIPRDNQCQALLAGVCTHRCAQYLKYQPLVASFGHESLSFLIISSRSPR